MKIKKLTMTMPDKIRLEVIATFADNTQDLFQINFYTNKNREHLKSENDLLNHIQDWVNWRKENIFKIPKDNNLIKLSLCFICNIKSVKKYPTIHKVISNNGKYYFEDNERLLNSNVKETSIEQIDEILKESDWNNDELVSSAINQVKKTIH